jgi:hypothetical protein
MRVKTAAKTCERSLEYVMSIPFVVYSESARDKRDLNGKRRQHADHTPFASGGRVSVAGVYATQKIQESTSAARSVRVTVARWVRSGG